MKQKNVSLLVAVGLALGLHAGAQNIIIDHPNSAFVIYDFTGTSLYQVSSSGNFAFVSPGGNQQNFEFGGTPGYEASLSAIAFGQPISTSTSFADRTYWGSLYYTSRVPSTTYFELLDTIGASTYYGWCEINYDGSSEPTVQTIAMDTTPNDINFTIGGVPEPSTLALGAVGLGGLLVSRRRARQ